MTGVFRCRVCRKGLMTLDRPQYRCPRCEAGQWVKAGRLRLLDRWRLWRETGHAPWTRNVHPE